jgi:hypothetical protein
MNPFTKAWKHSLLLICSFFFIFSLAHTQSLYPVSLEEKIANSPLIAEGKVIAQSSFWNDRHTMIYTSNTIELYKVFKGNRSIQTTIEVLTQGGTVEGNHVEASDLLTLKKDNIGIFFCFPNQVNLKSPSTKSLLYDVYSSSQGAILYDLRSQTASAPFTSYKNIQADLYKVLISKIGQNFKNLNPAFSVLTAGKPPVTNRVEAITISSFSPASVYAGALLNPAFNVLTINGSGFGTTPGGSCAVLFDDADNGTGGTPYTVAFNDPLIISWNDTQIKVRVPTNAGTGAVQVSDASGNLASAASSLEVVYSILTGTFNFSGTLYTKELNQVNINGSGGATIYYSTNTANSGTNLNIDPAKATFQRALNTWKEVAGYNVIEGGTTTVQAVASDGINTIMYDNTATGNAPLPSGTLAVCYTSSGVCNSSAQALITDFDVVIRKVGVSSGTVAFTIGPCPPNSSDYTQLDLETTLLHELGHSIGLGHINDSYTGSVIGQLNPNKLMNYAQVNSVKRVSPDYSAYAAALYCITPQGNAYGPCFTAGEMVPLTTITESKDNCPLTFPSSSLTTGTSIAFDLVHTTSNRFVDPAYTQVRCDGAGTPVVNNAYYAFKTNNAGGILSLNVNGYTPMPAALASCTSAYGGVLVTGIRMALYQVNSCPTAGAFPTPVACQTFTANGNLTNVNGLLSNTTYLLYLDGIDNTKATFNLTFTGSALPLKLTSFTGKVNERNNELFWTAEEIVNVKSILVQRSADGANFETLGEVPESAILHNNTYTDNNPLSRGNYYRLVTVNLDGSKEYSNTLLLTRHDNFKITAYPVPAKNTVYVDVSGLSQGNYVLTLSNAAGQRLKEVNSYISGVGKVINVNTSGLAAGIYFLHLADQKGIIIYHSPVVIN